MQTRPFPMLLRIKSIYFEKHMVDFILKQSRGRAVFILATVRRKKGQQNKILVIFNIQHFSSVDHLFFL